MYLCMHACMYIWWEKTKHNDVISHNGAANQLSYIPRSTLQTTYLYIYISNWKPPPPKNYSNACPYHVWHKQTFLRMYFADYQPASATGAWSFFGRRLGNSAFQIGSNYLFFVCRSSEPSYIESWIIHSIHLSSRNIQNHFLAKKPDLCLKRVETHPCLAHPQAKRSATAAFCSCPSYNHAG